MAVPLARWRLWAIEDSGRITNCQSPCVAHPLSLPAGCGSNLCIRMDHGSGKVRLC
jgi:hypothetical protein